MKRVIHWFRRDLRLHDNASLTAAAQRAQEIIPVYILNEQDCLQGEASPARLLFQLRSIAELRDSLAALGYPLIIRRGPPERELPQLAQELEAESVFGQIRYEPDVRLSDARVYKALDAMGVSLELHKDAVIWNEREVLTQAGRPFSVFTPFAKAWNTRKIPTPHPRLPRSRARIKTGMRSDRLPADPAELGMPCSQEILPAGEEAGLKMLEDFLKHTVYAYEHGRDRVDLEGTSKLSAHLCAGTLGIRTVFARLAEARTKASAAGRKSCDVFRTELIWREFYYQVLHNFPDVMKGPFRPEMERLQWSDNEEYFKAWCHGRTGYPIVDAAMRCLNATGWMHNRLRMIVAMFLTKDLLINWQWGEQYFMKQLVDGDQAANNGGWQWSAGTGTDAAPYFRIFNPTTQAQKCDPNGNFVRRWVPELSELEGADVHEPWREPLLAKGYPDRIVLHEEQRPKALAMFAAVKER